MKRIVVLMCMLVPCSMYCSETENKAPKKIVTTLTRITESDGTSKRVLTTSNSKGEQLKTTVKFAKDGKTTLGSGAVIAGTISQKDLLRLVAVQNIHHVQLAIGGLKALSSEERLNATAIVNYVESTGYTFSEE